MKLSYGAAGTYAGWDRFGRIIEQKWTNTAGTVRDHETYGYDFASNRTARNKLNNTALNEVYAFDGLDRLASVTRAGAAYQSWAFDSLSNWSSVTKQGTTQNRTHNAANEVATASGQTAPQHDAAGNLAKAAIPGGGTTQQWYTYDAWNRLIRVQADNAGVPGAEIVRFEYDGAATFDEQTYSYLPLERVCAFLGFSKQFRAIFFDRPKRANLMWRIDARFLASKVGC